MIILLTLLAFAFAALMVTAGAMALAPSGGGTIERRLGELTGRPMKETDEPRLQRVAGALKRLGTAVPHSEKEMGKLQLRLVRSGFRSHDAVIVFFGVRIGLALLLFGLLGSGLFMRPNLGYALIAAAVGYLLPSMALGKLERRRQHRIRLGLPDALDLLVVSVEAGLGLDQAIQRVGEEIAFAHRELSDELRLVNLELRAGKGRTDALRALAERTGVDDRRRWWRCWCRPTASARASRSRSACTPTRCVQAASAGRRSRGQDRRQDGLPAGVLYLSGHLGRHDRTSGHQVRAGPHPDRRGAMTMGATAAVLDQPSMAAPTGYPAPVTLADTGLSADMVMQLFMKSLYAGEASGMTLAERLRLPFGILEPLIERGRVEQLIEVRGASRHRGGNLSLQPHRWRAQSGAAVSRRQQLCRPRPVTLAVYVQAMNALRAARGYVNRDRIARIRKPRRRRLDFRAARAGDQRRQGRFSLWSGR